MKIINQFIKSLYSAKDMASYRFQKIGRSILYVFLLSALASIPLVYQLHTLFSDEFLGIKHIIIEELPDFNIEGGTLQTDDPTPITNYSSTFTFVFDPEATEVDSTVNNSDSFFAILKDRVVLRAATQEETLQFSALGTGTFSKSDTIELFTILEEMYPIFMVIMIVIAFLLTSFLKFLTVTIFGYLATLFSKSSGRTISYKQGWNIIAYTLTIPTVFFFIMDLLGITVPYSTSLQTFIVFFLLFLIIREIPQQRKINNSK